MMNKELKIVLRIIVLNDDIKGMKTDVDFENNLSLPEKFQLNMVFVIGLKPICDNLQLLFKVKDKIFAADWQDGLGWDLSKIEPQQQRTQNTANDHGL